MKSQQKPQKPASPAPPDELDADAQKHWKSLCDDLESAGTVEKTDRKTIALTAQTMAMLARVETELASSELTSVADNGREFINPRCGLYTTLVQSLTKLLRELKLTPATRGKVERLPDDPLNDFLKR